ncbi:hypothetical protein HanIR_Chr06g0288391 [Helianthus annuus]|nr:hypothetical protein HanIR_Chr06g0288391 [Helianthus annuus]
METIVSVRPSNHSTNYSVWVRRFSISPLSPSCAAVLDSVLWDRCTPVMDLFWIVVAKTDNITHLFRVLSKDIVNLSHQRNIALITLLMHVT